MRMAGTLHYGVCTFMERLAKFLEREMFQKKIVEKIKTHILCSITFFFENRALYDIM